MAGDLVADALPAIDDKPIAASLPLREAAPSLCSTAVFLFACGPRRPNSFTEGGKSLRHRPQ